MYTFYTKFKSPIIVLMLITLLGGVFSLSKIQSGLFPDITFPKIKIIAENGQQPVDKMMVTVTIPLENAIKKVQDLNLIRSTTSRGSCEISAFLNWNTDIDLGKQRIEAQINAIKQQLPPDVNITIEKMNPSILPVMGFSLEGEGKSQIELRQIAEFTIKPFLSRVNGVSEIAVIGGKTKEYHIIIDPIKLSQLGITPKTIADVLAQSNIIASTGYIKDYNRLYLTITDAAIDSKEELENTIISNSPKRIIKLKDISKIEIGELKEYIKINANGKNVPLIAVVKQPNSNLIEVVDSIKSQITQLNKILPKGVVLKPFYNQADFVGDSINSLKDVLWVGLLLAIIVTIIFLRSLKGSTVILITIPITLSLTITILYALGYTFNIMTIGAIAAAIGLIIDDAIVVVEQIHRTHEENPNTSTHELIPKAIKYLFPAMVGSSLSTIVIFLPFALMSGVAGAYFKVLTDTMIITLISSFFITWIGLPVVYLLLSRKEHSIKTKEGNKTGWVYFFIKRPFIAISIVVLLIFLAYFLLPKLPSGFLPEMDEGSIVLDYSSPPGTSLEDTDKMLQYVDNVLNTIPEVESFSRRTGTQMGFFITEPNRGDYLIQLKKKRNKTTTQVSDEIRNKIESALPSLRVDFGQVITDMLGDLMSSVQPIEIKIFGDDKTTLYKLADEVAALVQNTNGTADVFNGITIAGPELTFDPNIAKLSQYQLSPQDFQFQMQTKIEGSVVGSMLEKNRMVDIRMIEQKKDRTINELRNTSIFLPDGRLKPIDEFANFRLTSGVAQIERENLKQMVAVTARLNNRDLGSTLADIQKNISSKINLPQGYQIVYGGSYAEQQQAFKELITILLLAVLLVFTVILFLFRKVRIGFAIIFLSVLGISGSVLALFLTGTPLNVGSYIGLIMIVGIIGENSIFTYLQFSEAKQNGMKRDEAITYAISVRLRPNLMTALGAITALFPLALGIGSGAQLHQPLAIAIIGGFTIAIPLLVIVFPSILKLIEK
ncbi:Putative transporter [Ignavibacterium album JCM 16511]|uniref:Putative transporter n=1 Tax=Ignavibacterium album (strain DSM 19864 / JCM 16511 / NBRC 101810 / Mat9-16) TaxID=945713 RepID=I0AFX8_IGNAJ|nr:efflux RND transporter permease subunit [Ignavibacterium album]AFH47885.1 Putative transporter [Ignavibacterium album JCM 16511]